MNLFLRPSPPNWRRLDSFAHQVQRKLFFSCQNHPCSFSFSFFRPLILTFFHSFIYPFPHSLCLSLSLSFDSYWWKNDAFRLQNPESVSLLWAVWRQQSVDYTDQRWQETLEENLESIFYRQQKQTKERKNERTRKANFGTSLQRGTQSFNTFFLLFLGSFFKKKKKKKKKKKRKKKKEKRRKKKKKIIKKKKVARWCQRSRTKMQFTQNDRGNIIQFDNSQNGVGGRH